MRPQISRILRDLQSTDEDIATYAAMNILRLKEIREEDVEVLMPVLRKTVSSPNISVRFFSKKALNEMKLQTRKFVVLASRMDRLRDDSRASSWTELLTEVQDADVDKKMVILDLLKDVDDPLVLPALVDYMNLERDEYVLAEVIKLVGLIGKPEILGTLTKFLSHKDSRIRSNAAEALEEIGGKEVVKSLVPLLEDDDNRVKATVARIVAKHGEANVLTTVANMMRSVEIWMRESATYALGHIAHQEAVDLLMEACLDVNPEIQRKAVEGLGKLRAKKAHDFLSRLGLASEPGLAAAARTALERIERHPAEYDYYDPSGPLAKGSATSTSTSQVSRSGRTAKPAPGRPKMPVGPDPTEASPPAEPAPRRFPFSWFGRSQAKNDQKEIEELDHTRQELMVDLGKKILTLFRKGEYDMPELKDVDHEIKKLTYLIEQKESHKKEIQVDSLKTTFINFLKDSVHRFSLEKRVDNRITNLHQRVLDTYGIVGRRVMAEYRPDDPDNMRLDGIPEKILKLERKLDGLRGTPQDDTEVVAPPPPTSLPKSDPATTVTRPGPGTQDVNATPRAAPRRPAGRPDGPLGRRPR